MLERAGRPLRPARLRARRGDRRARAAARPALPDRARQGRPSRHRQVRRRDRRSACSPTATTSATQALTADRQHLGVHRQGRHRRAPCCRCRGRRFQAWPTSPTALRAQVARPGQRAARPQDQHGEADDRARRRARGRAGAAGHLRRLRDWPRASTSCRVAQTVLRVHTRVADLYNQPMNQIEQQLRLTVEALRERQEHELINNPDFGLLHNADLRPAHPDPRRARRPRTTSTSCSRGRRRTRSSSSPTRGPSPPSAASAPGAASTRTASTSPGTSVPAWRGVPLFPCNKIPITDGHTTSILAMRTGEDDQGVVGLHQTGIPDEYEPGPQRPLHGHQRQGDHLLPGQRLLLRRDPGPRRARRAGERRNLPARSADCQQPMYDQRRHAALQASRLLHAVSGPAEPATWRAPASTPGLGPADGLLRAPSRATHLGRGGAGRARLRACALTRTRTAPAPRWT